MTALYSISDEHTFMDAAPTSGTQDRFMSRRGFLGVAAGLATAALLPSIASAQRTNPYYRPLRAYLRSRFNTTELSLINRAVAIVAHRFLDPRMFAWTRNRYSRAFTQLPAGTYRPGQFQNWFAGIQLPVLRQRGFPPIYIAGQYDARGGWTGRAPIYRVVTQFRVDPRTRRSVPYLSGTFSITLNTALLGNARLSYGRSPDYWAGAIAHEMLHNLGHQHPQNFYEGTFIRAYENAVRHNANPRVRG